MLLEQQVSDVGHLVVHLTTTPRRLLLMLLMLLACPSLNEAATARATCSKGHEGLFYDATALAMHYIPVHDIRRMSTVLDVTCSDQTLLKPCRPSGFSCMAKS